MAKKTKIRWRSFFDSMWLREKVLIALIAILICVPVVVLLFRFISAFIVTFPVSGGTYTEGIVGSPQAINPLYSTSSEADRSISYLVYSGLTRIDKFGNVIPDLAENWEVSQDGKQYTFHVKKNAFWHDGEQVYSQDVFYTYSITQDPDYLGPLKNRYRNIQMELPDEYTIVFKLAKDDPQFLEKTTLGIVPQHRWAQYSIEDIPYAEENLRPVGSGMFLFKEGSTDENGRMIAMTLSRNDSYYEEKPHLDSIVFKFYQSDSEAKDALIKKEIDGTTYVPFDSYNELRGIGRIRMISREVLGYKAIYPNSVKVPVFATANFRKAFDLAIDKERLIREDLYGNAVEVLGLYRGNREDYSYDAALSEAKKLMESLGVIDTDNDGLVEVAGQPLKLKLSIVQDNESKAVAKRVKEDERKIGIEIEIEEKQPAEFERDVLNPRNYQLVFFGQSYGKDKNIYPLWHSSQWKAPGLNFSSITSKRVDALLENYAKENDVTKKAEVEKTINILLANDYYAFFLYEPVHNFATDKRIKGIMKNYFVYPEDRFINIDEWFTKTAWAFDR